MAVKVTHRTAPVIVLSEGFEEGIADENVGARKVVSEYELAMAHASAGGAHADKLDGNAVGLEGGDWVGDDLGLDLVQVAHGKLGSAS